MQRARANAFWTECEYVLPLAGNDLAAALTPLRADYGNDPTTNNGFVAGDYDEANGLSGNSGDYLGSGITPSSSLALYDVHVCAYTDKTGTDNDVAIGCADSLSTAFLLYIRHGGTTTYTDLWRRNYGGRIAATDTMGGGMRLMTRTASNRQDLYTGNGSTSFSSIANNTNTLIGSRPGRELHMMGNNEVGTPSNFFLSDMQWMSVGLSFDSTQASNYFNAVQEFNTILGRQS